jgi:hypothetical protein
MEGLQELYRLTHTPDVGSADCESLLICGERPNA